MKLIVALNNEKIKSKLTEKYGSDVYEQDITYMEGVIEFISRYNDEITIITKDTLSGNLTKILYVKQIRLANPNAKVIYIVGNLTDEYKEFLFANEIFNIIEGNEIEVDNIIDCIENGKEVVYKNNEISYIPEFAFNEPAQDMEYLSQNQVITKQLIAVYGTSGAGKSVCSSIIAKEIADRLNISVALLDMDFENSSMDIINNIDTNISSLTSFVEDIDKMIDINNNMESYMIKDKRNSKISYFTNKTGIFECQNKLSVKYYSKIYSAIKSAYDYTIVDLPASPFLDIVLYTLNISTKVFFVINANYTSIRQATKYLDMLTKLWEIPKSKIGIVVNKVQKDSLDNIQIEAMLKDYEVIANIGNNKSMEAYVNGVVSNIDFSINCDKIYDKLGVKNVNSKKKKFKPINLFINKKGNNNDN